MTADTADLLPCPFCGGNDISQSVGKNGDGSPYHYVECGTCGATAEPENWNCRASHQARAALSARAPEGWADMLGHARAVIASLSGGPDGSCAGTIQKIDAMLSASPPPPEQKEEKLAQALLEATQQEFSMARRMRAAIVEARRRLAKGRALWNGPCHECDSILQEALSADCPVRHEHDEATAEPIASPAPGPAEPVVKAHVGYSTKNACWWVRVHGCRTEAGAYAFRERILSALTPQPAPPPMAGGEDWRTRYPDAEALYTTPDAELSALRERCAQALTDHIQGREAAMAQAKRNGDEGEVAAQIAALNALGMAHDAIRALPLREA